MSENPAPESLEVTKEEEPEVEPEVEVEVEVPSIQPAEEAKRVNSRR